MMARVVLPMEEMAARASEEDLDDPLAYVRGCAINVLDHLATDPRCQRVFEICCHKVEYVDEMLQVRQRHIEARNNCLQHMERGLRNAARKGLLAPAVNPRLAAAGLHALVDGLIMNWVLDPKHMALGRDATVLVDQYLDALRPAPAGATSRKPVRRAAESERA
jgi:TetR/AcrR family acrAB operon transcriptional repressor